METKQSKPGWKDMSPKKKRIFMVLGVVGGLLSAAAIADILFTTNDKPKNQKDTVTRNVLTNTNTRQLGIDGLSASVQRMRREISDLSATVTKNIEQQDSFQKSRNLEIEKELASLKKEIREMKIRTENSNSQLRQDIRKAGQVQSSSGAEKQSRGKADTSSRERTQTSSGSTFVRGSGNSNRGLQKPTDLFSNQQEAFKNENETRDDEEEEVESLRSKPLKINVINGAPPEKVKRENEKRIKEKETGKTAEIEFYMPTGSIISGMLLNGIDASTSSSAKNEPMPALIRVQKEAILPNRFTSDIKDCFVLVSGHGDLSSERAYLRGEYLSCVRTDGAVLETHFPSYVVGEDGKAGMKGRLVSKQGQMIARSLVAGFASGISKAFDVTPVSVLDTTSIGGSVQYQNNFSSGLVRGAAAQGASQALERIADFYIKMAEQIFPVVEITAGRSIDIVVTNGTKLKLKNMNELSDTHESTPTVRTSPVTTLRTSK